MFLNYLKILVVFVVCLFIFYRYLERVDDKDYERYFFLLCFVIGVFIINYLDWGSKDDRRFIFGLLEWGYGIKLLIGISLLIGICFLVERVLGGRLSGNL